MKRLNKFWIVLFVMLAPSLSGAKVTELVIENTESAFGGKNFGSVGQYERLRGYAVGELDPSDLLNAGIVNIGKAPLNGNGRVEYRVDVEIIKPVNLANGNGYQFYDVVNRGNPLAINFVNGVSEFLMERGYSLVWSGWQGDVTLASVRLGTSFPVATNGVDPIVGLSREEFIVSNNNPTFLGNLVYPANDVSDGLATLTVRENEQDARQTPAGLGFTYINEKQIEITRPSDPAFDGGAIYEFIYPAKDPIVMGIGFAATRDVNSFLRYEVMDSAEHPNPLAPAGVPAMTNAIAIGVSQSGRFLKDLIYQGFNQDEQGRQVFDGAVPIISGSRKTFTNYEFAQPGRFSRQHEDHSYPGDQFPFTYATLVDPITGNTDSVLARCEATATCPKIIHFDSGTEIWQARGSLVVTDGNPAGSSDITLAPNARVYLMTGTQHGPAGTPSFGICQQLSNPLNYRPILRALIAALHQWVADGTEPPQSRYGSASNGTLVSSSTGFPSIPGVTYNGLLNGLTVNDFSFQPPAEGASYEVLVSKLDKDGNGINGVRHPMLDVPTATYAGWNLRAAGQAENEVCSLSGSYIPFAETKAARKASGDPRRSLEQRYSSHGKYVRKIAASARKLVKKRLLLQEDADRIIQAAEESSVGGNNHHGHNDHDDDNGHHGRKGR